MSSRTLRVWAPRATDVELVIGDTRHPMTPAGIGWFACEIEGLSDDMEYSYSLDGQDPVPDPRSRSQPSGVHGPSRPVEPDRTSATDAWKGFPLSAAVISELHVGTFTPEGTFDACIERLGHLQTLGVNAIELMPLAEYPGRRGWGYDGVDLFAPHSAYGGPDGLLRLVDACHERDIAVIVDVVYNHLGPEGDYLPDFGRYFALLPRAGRQSDQGDETPDERHRGGDAQSEIRPADERRTGGAGQQPAENAAGALSDPERAPDEVQDRVMDGGREVIGRERCTHAALVSARKEAADHCDAHRAPDLHERAVGR